MSSAPDEPKPRARRPQHLVVGRVVRPHGVRGDLLVEPLSEVLDSIQPGGHVFLGDRRRGFPVVSLRRHARKYLLRIEGCNGRDEAESFRGEELRVRLEDAAPLPPGKFYRWQVIGLRVVTEDGRRLGTVRQILETGANDVYAVQGESGKEILLPAITSVIRKIDPETGEMRVRLMPGLLDEEA
ncbi:MAG TPA: ribosome maturation factor RimM [Anaerolineales bacterium]|nr:ribosome maturation factor RimM [Anaerolineales bacterium]